MLSILLFIAWPPKDQFPVITSLSKNIFHSYIYFYITMKLLNKTFPYGYLRNHINTMNMIVKINRNNSYFRHLMQTSACFNKSFMIRIWELQISLFLDKFDLTELLLMWHKREAEQLWNYLHQIFRAYVKEGTKIIGLTK